MIYKFIEDRNRGTQCSPFGAILLQNLDNFWLFQGVSAQDAKIKSLLLRIAQPQNVDKINLTIFLQFEHSNHLKYPKKSRFGAN